MLLPLLFSGCSEEHRDELNNIINGSNDNLLYSIKLYQMSYNIHINRRKAKTHLIYNVYLIP